MTVTELLPVLKAAGLHNLVRLPTPELGEPRCCWRDHLASDLGPLCWAEAPWAIQVGTYCEPHTVVSARTILFWYATKKDLPELTRDGPAPWPDWLDPRTLGPHAETLAARVPLPAAPLPELSLGAWVRGIAQRGLLTYDEWLWVLLRQAVRDALETWLLRQIPAAANTPAT